MADFSYFDQFQDVQIDLTYYLKSISPSGSSYTFTNIQPVVTTVKNLFTKYDIIYDYKKDINLILNYSVKDNEFIETVAYNVYGSVDFWWIVALFNNVKDPFRDWLLSQAQVIQLAKTLYEQERKYTYDVYLKFISENNEKKRELVLPKNDVVKDLIWKYRQAIING